MDPSTHGSQKPKNLPYELLVLRKISKFFETQGYNKIKRIAQHGYKTPFKTKGQFGNVVSQ
jgi:hypothetical protein